jgi:hypothetical protein
MKKLTRSESGSRWLATAAGIAAGVYGAYVGVTWSRYGRPARPAPAEEDPLLDQFMPHYDVVERHRVRVDAPAATTLEVASNLDLFDLPAVRAIFKGRELLLGSAPGERPAARGMLAAVQALGWVVLADDPGREVVLGAVTKPWEANPTFRSLPPDDFRAFAEPDYVKIAWTLRADPAGRGASMFRTETRAVATDAAARSRFRVYWSLLSPGIFLIRWLSLGPVKAGAERRARSLSGL